MSHVSFLFRQLDDMLSCYPMLCSQDMSYLAIEMYAAEIEYLRLLTPLSGYYPGLYF